jgi:hypothetical protein
MRLNAIAVAAALAAGVALTSPLATAGSLSAPGAAAAPPASASLMQEVSYRGYCFRWRNICADRWGWGTWRFYRCLRIHGC